MEQHCIDSATKKASSHAQTQLRGQLGALIASIQLGGGVRPVKPLSNFFWQLCTAKFCSMPIMRRRREYITHALPGPDA